MGVAENGLWNRPISEILSQDGAGSVFNANVNGSVTPEYFEAGPAAGVDWVIHRLLIELTDAATFFSAANYGGINGALTNGLVLWRVAGTGASATQLDMLTATGNPIKANRDWALQCFDVEQMDWGGVGEPTMRVRWTFWDGKHGTPILLRGDKSEAIQLTISDDLTALTSHRFNVEGETFNSSQIQNV